MFASKDVKPVLCKLEQVHSLNSEVQEKNKIILQNTQQNTWGHSTGPEQ